MKVATRRLLEEQIAVDVVLESGKKDDAMWHVLHYHIATPSRTISNLQETAIYNNLHTIMLGSVRAELGLVICNGRRRSQQGYIPRRAPTENIQLNGLTVQLVLQYYEIMSKVIF